ncbi:hypothetical protein DIPPA_25429 [Diplonema papillatum]|nr:hypothetical protein DIPPA_25429 [Diplonema papillatum]
MGDSRLLVCFDGGARANGTAFAVAGAGAVMYRDGVKVSEVILPLPTVRSNNVAEYEAVLAGLHLLNEANDADGTQCTRAQARHTGYAASSLKSLFVPPSKYTVYKVHITVPTNDEYTGVPAGDETRATMMMRGNIAKMCAGLGPQGPRPNTDFFTSVSVQIFMLGEEVEASMPFHGVLAGQRGVVTELGQEHLTVSFKVNGHSKEVTVHRVLFESSVQIGGRVTPVTTDPAAKASWHVVKPAGDSRIVKTRLWFFPIAHVKMEKPEYYYRAPVLQGSQPGADMPSVLIDFQGLRRLGSNRALYAALALAPSLDKVVVRAETLPILSVFHKTPRTYLAAVLFHNRLSKNLQNLPCAVCGQLLSGPCPMEDRDPAVKECPSLWERYRHCAGNYRRCDVDEVVMTRMEYMAQTKETALVRCECGTVVRFRDLKAHRAQYVVGISCAGPRKKKSSKSA